MQKPFCILHSAFCIALLTSACASLPAAPPPVAVPAVTWEQKLAWMMRLEDQRLLRDPNPPPPVVLRAATPRAPQVLAPPPPSDLLRLLDDDEARVRRRAALALGRVGLPEAIEPLSRRLTDADAEVRQMAAFALGLIGDPAARPALLTALGDATPIVQGRAAEALGRLAIVLTQRRSPRWCRCTSPPVRWPASRPMNSPIRWRRRSRPCASACSRWCVSAVRRAGVGGARRDGQPVSRWWPVAYALQRVGDAQAAPALAALLATPGRYTAAFAVGTGGGQGGARQCATAPDRRSSARPTRRSSSRRCARWWRSASDRSRLRSPTSSARPTPSQPSVSRR